MESAKIFLSSDSSSRVLSVAEILSGAFSVVFKNVYIEKSEEPLDDCGAFQVFMGLREDIPAFSRFSGFLNQEDSPKKPESYTIVFISDNTVLISAADIGGLRLAVFDFACNRLGFRPLKFWTGINEKDAGSELMIPAGKKITRSPVFPYRVFSFGKYEESMFAGENRSNNMLFYIKVIDSASALGFNTIDISRIREHMLLRNGRIDENDFLDLEEIHRYIKANGLLMQSDMSLGWEVKTELDREKGCWSRYSDLWEDKWQVLLENSLLGGSDIFRLRARAIVWDAPYSCVCDKCVKRDVYEIVESILDSFMKTAMEAVPDAVLVCELSHEYFGAYLDGRLNIPEEWIIVLEDDLFGELDESFTNLPKGRDYGVYLHCGSEYNRAVQEQFLAPLFKSFSFAISEGLTKYVMVNGQFFKNFLLNITYASNLLSGDTMDPDLFLKEKWAGRYFPGSENSIIELETLLKNAVQRTGISGREQTKNLRNERGFLFFIRKVIWAQIDYINGDRGVPPVSNEYFDNLMIDWDPVQKKAENIYNSLDGHFRDFFEDYYLLPIRVFYMLVNLAYFLNKYTGTDDGGEMFLYKADDVLKDMHSLLETGSILEQWQEHTLSLKKMIEDEIPPAGAFTEFLKELDNG